MMKHPRRIPDVHKNYYFSFDLSFICWFYIFTSFQVTLSKSPVSVTKFTRYVNNDHFILLYWLKNLKVYLLFHLKRNCGKVRNWVTKSRGPRGTHLKLIIFRSYVVDFVKSDVHHSKIWRKFISDLLVNDVYDLVLKI